MALALAIPGMTVFAPSAAEEIAAMLDTALESEGPSTIRFPRPHHASRPRRCRPRPARPRYCAQGDGSICLLGVGKLVGACLDAADELAAEGIVASVWDVRVVSPPDPDMLADAATHSLVITAEDGVRHGGAGSFLIDGWPPMSTRRSHVAR